MVLQRGGRSEVCSVKFQKAQEKKGGSMSSDDLIQKAKSIPYPCWEAIDELIDLATDMDTVQRLARIQNHKYHQEEASAGML